MKEHDAMSGPEDRISWRAKVYAATRPDYPDHLFECLDSLSPGHDLAWDCATANGQAAIPLARTFRSVVATDADGGQISYAKAHPRIRYAVARADRAQLPDASVDLVTVAQALHWFARTEFYAEVGRVLRPGGVFAAWSSFLPSDCPEVDAAVSRLYHEVLKDYWPCQAKFVEERYESIPFPFEEVARRTLPMVGHWGLPRLAAYLGTWAAVPRYVRQTGREPIDEVLEGLESGWGKADALREVRWTITLRVGKKDS
jgi:SAM-dependent methyltransferase